MVGGVIYLIQGFVDSQGNPVDPNQICIGVGAALGILIFMIFLIIIVRGSKKRRIRKIYKQWGVIARAFGANPPVQTDKWTLPDFIISKPEGNIRVRAMEYHYYDQDPDPVDVSPYEEEGSVLEDVIDFFDDRRDYNRTMKHAQKTEISLSMPNYIKGSRILIIKESLFGKFVGTGEVQIDDKVFDKTFNIKGADTVMVNNILTPELRTKLMEFKKKFGKFQLNEKRMFWMKNGYSTSKIHEVITAMFEIGRIINKM